MRHISVMAALLLLAGCSGSSGREGDFQDTMAMSADSAATVAQGVGVSSLPRMGFGGLAYFNSSDSQKDGAENASGFASIDSVVIEGDEIAITSSMGAMAYTISFPDSYETISEESYGWRFMVSRKDTSFVDLSEIRLYEEDKDGLPYFAFVCSDGKWSSWDIITWQDLPKRKIMAKYPSEEEVASFQEKRLGEDFVGL